MSDSVFTRPPVHPFVECPNCKELTEYGLKFCPRCREEIPPDYAMLSAAVVHLNTQAISVAKTITTFDAFIPIAFVVLVAVIAMGWYSQERSRLPFALFVPPVLTLLGIIVWYFRFGRFKLGDQEYLDARHDMFKSFLLWLAFLTVQVLCILYFKLW
jgi:RNA polymerase subunit RPABC4/transcription elongation factor Spt4